jgi:hypothetical protein
LKYSEKWYIRYTDADGIKREIVGFKDKVATIQLAANSSERPSSDKRAFEIRSRSIGAFLSRLIWITSSEPC